MSDDAQTVVDVNENTPTTDIHKFTYSNGCRQLINDSVIAEQPLQITLLWEDNSASNSNVLNSKVFSITMRTPGDDEALIIGLLQSEGIIRQHSDIHSIQLDAEQDPPFNSWEVRIAQGVEILIASLERFQVTYSSCGLCGTTSLKSLELRNPPTLSRHPRWLSPDVITGLTTTMRDNQTLFRQTGSAHAAALFDEQGQLVNIEEDIGRHNAVDKLTGNHFKSSHKDLLLSCLVVSGRVSFEIVQKSVMAGIPVLIAVGAPSDLAILAAKRFDLTLIGFANQTSFNLYHGEWRLHSLEDTCQKI